MTSSKSSQSQKATKCKFYVREMSTAGKWLETESKLAVAGELSKMGCWWEWSFFSGLLKMFWVWESWWLQNR